MESIYHVAHALQAFAETSYAMIESGFLVVYTFLAGLAAMYWDTLESVATFLSISMNWLYTNIAILAVFLVAFMVYRTTGTTPSGSVRSARSKGKKKAE